MLQKENNILNILEQMLLLIAQSEPSIGTTHPVASQLCSIYNTILGTNQQPSCAVIFHINDTLLIVEGLNGEFSIISGNALFYQTQKGKHIIALPKNIEWPGTLILAEIPLAKKSINLYDYIS